MTNVLRLIVPQWQGGESGAYPLGAQLLAWLAPPTDADTVEIPISEISELPLPIQDGIAGRFELLAQTRAIRAVLEERQPDRLVVFGGDCLVDQAPFAYLNERYGGRLGVLWLDAHPDVATPAHRNCAHTMILGNLLGKGDPSFAAEVPVRLDPKRVLLVGLSRLMPYEELELESLGLSTISTDALSRSSTPILEWIRASRIEHLAIHLDLDVLSPLVFRAQGFAAPGQVLNGIERERIGSMTFEQLVRIISDVSLACEVVGLGITEHKPWDAINLRNMLAEIPILKGN